MAFASTAAAPMVSAVPIMEGRRTEASWLATRRLLASASKRVCSRPAFLAVGRSYCWNSGSENSEASSPALVAFLMVTAWSPFSTLMLAQGSAWMRRPSLIS